MRENIFRVYCEFEFEGKITKCMESPASWFLMTQTGKLWTYDPGEAPRPLAKEYKKAIPLFYTGLKDKNGVEIYEGDIIKFKHSLKDRYQKYQIGQIMWIERICGFATMTSKKDFIEKPWLGLLSLIEGIEIIGNIYENPELMEEENK